MHLPRMTTRRWMVAVVALSVALGGYREVMRLKRIRVQYLTRAAWHSAGEAYHRGIVSSAATSVLRRKMAAQEWEAPEPAVPEPAVPTPDRAIELLSGFPEMDTTQADDDGHARFKEARARVSAMVARREMILDKDLQRQMGYHQELVDHHAAMARKYRRAARYPWLPLESDPPKPE
jgi:hypothetical protein